MTKKYFTRLLQASLMCCLAVFFTACDEFGSEDNPTPAYLSMSDSPVTIKAGDTFKRKAISVGTAVVEYTSSDTDVATVDNEGLVTAIAEGTTTITATATGYSSQTGKKIYQPDSKSYKLTVKPATPPAATITTAPVATPGSIIAGSATALVTAGVADGGTMMYQVTATNTKPTTTDGFSATIPTAATLAAGTYYVWYYAKADADHSDSDISATAIEVKVQSGLLAGKFSVSATKQVQFSQGNLQATYDGTKWTWAFAEHQWDYIGDAEGNTKVTNSAPFVAGYTGSSTTVDLFGWVGASSTWTGVNQYGVTSSNATSVTDGYGNVATENLKSDWGTNMGTGWRTLTGGTGGEWDYLFNTRTTTSGIHYARAKVNDKNGVILLPDDWDASYYALTSTNTPGASYTTNVITLDDWTNKLEAHGAVFLPAAGYRNVTAMSFVGSLGLYWSSSPYTDEFNAYCAYFNSTNLNPAANFSRYLGFSVRLVRDAE